MVSVLLFVYWKKKIRLTKGKKNLDHDVNKNAPSPINRLQKEKCGKGTLYLPLVLLHAQIKSTFKVKKHIIFIAFSSATKRIIAPVADQFNCARLADCLLLQESVNLKSENSRKVKNIMHYVRIHYFFEVQFVVCCHGTAFKECMEYLKNKVKKQAALSCYSLQIFWHSEQSSWVSQVLDVTQFVTMSAVSTPGLHVLLSSTLFLWHWRWNMCHQGGILCQ